MLEVFQEGTERLHPIRKFEDAGLHPAMLENTQLAGYLRPTPIQAYTLPAIFQGKDLIACAQTGKTSSVLHD
jgi:ATP-dependent RNA helicase DDX3X